MMAAPASRVGIEADAALVPMRPPLAGEECAAEQVGPDGHAVVAPLVALGPDAGQCGLVREQGKLKRLGHRCHVWAGFSGKCISEHPIRGEQAQGMLGRRAVWEGGLIHYCL